MKLFIFVHGEMLQKALNLNKIIYPSREELHFSICFLFFLHNRLIFFSTWLQYCPHKETNADIKLGNNID